MSEKAVCKVPGRSALTEIKYSKLEDNPDMLRNDPGYEAKLFAVGDKATAMALRHGDWSVVSGSMFAEAWDKSKHVINPFAIPYSWGHPTMGRIWRGADDGFAAPAAVVWMTRGPGPRFDIT